MDEVKDPENIEQLKKKVSELIDFDCNKYSDSFLARRFFIRLRKNNILTYKEYIPILIKSREEQEELKKELTIHVTHFFRDKDFWNALKDEVIPTLCEEKKEKTQHTINIWSAGCSSGEEPISIAITFLEALGPKTQDYRINILGTDYDSEILKKALNANYEEQQFRETDAKIKEQYFTKTAAGTYTPKPEITSMIKYKQADLFSNTERNMDMIFCRNVVIYFDRDAKRMLYNKFYESLNPGGYLILGKTEYLDGEAREKLKIVNMRERIYKKEN